MSVQGRHYHYVGPEGLRSLVREGGEGQPLRSRVDFVAWAEQQTAQELAEPFTFVIDAQGFLRLAPRRSEHVVCAGGEPVLSAGEMRFRVEGAQHWTVDEASNQSTGYCPDADSWPDVAAALDGLGLPHPPGFTHKVIFRRCPACRELNIVREDDFVCVFCEETLPQEWNVSGHTALLRPHEPPHGYRHA
ncbi:hypothetical protein ACIBI4_16860 [Streptomyces sp. NPDC050418]|uniref:hypothetical protein n=1 Tax=Streptomyces sp. NPDC050418 TaxID=3365612 RepID=UPI003795C239